MLAAICVCVAAVAQEPPPSPYRAAAKLPFKAVAGNGNSANLIVYRARNLTLIKGGDGHLFGVRTAEATAEDTAPFIGFSSAANAMFSIEVFKGFNVRAGDVRGVDPLKETANYYPSADKATWQSGIQVFRGVRYHEIYPHIDALLFPWETYVRYRFEVGAGADPKQIQLEFARAALDGQGNLVTADVSGYPITQAPPRVTQPGVPATAKWQVTGDRFVTPLVESYNPAQDFVIDFDIVKCVIGPERKGLTIFTPNGAVAVNDGPAIYGAGLTSDGIAIWKQFAAGDPIFSTYISMFSRSPNSLLAIQPDSQDNVFVALTNPNLTRPLPTTRSSCTTNCVGPYVMKLNSRGELIEAALASSPDNDATAIAVDSKGAIYTGGKNLPNNIPLKNSCCPAGSLRGYLIKHDPLHRDGNEIVYGTMLGDFYMPKTIRVSEGIVYVAGEAGAASGTQPASLSDEAFQKCGSDDNPAGEEAVTSLAIDDDGNVYAGGFTCSPAFVTTPAAYQRDARGTTDGFVVKFDSSLKHLRWSTRLGGTDEDAVTALAVDADQNVYVGGWTKHDFPQVVAPDETLSADVTPKKFLAKFNSICRNLLHSTLFAGDGGDRSNFSLMMLENGFVMAQGTFGPALAHSGLTGAEADMAGSFATVMLHGPTVGTFDPHIRRIEATPLKVTIEGGSFDSSAVVLINDKPATVTRRTANALVADVPSDIEGPFEISVVNGDNKSATRNAIPKASPAASTIALARKLPGGVKFAIGLLVLVLIAAFFVRRG